MKSKSSLLFSGTDIISINDLGREEILYVLKKAHYLEQLSRGEKMNLAPGRILASLFFEPSTRTRLSFESAIYGLGGKVIGFSSGEGSSVSKGESLWDTIRTVSQYSDIIVVRHPEDGAARLAAEASPLPVINAGDGSNQHPTQTLLDLFSIQKIRGEIDNTVIGIVGDLKYGRTVHSLASALSRFTGTRIHFVSPPSLVIPHHTRCELIQRNVSFTEHELIEEVIDKVDILYMTRIQQERFPEPAEYEKVKEVYHLDAHMLAGSRPGMKVLHPLPRVSEIARNVDETPFCYYFQQAKNGVAVRQALVCLLLGIMD